jgi:hypothetical protein
MKYMQRLIAVGAALLSAGVCRGAVDVTLAWDPSVTDINGQALAAPADYRLFYSETSGTYSEYVDAGSSTTAAVTGLEYNKTYFFKAKAYTETGESGFSEEFSWKAPTMPDSDADGISDSWETEHFASLDTANSSTDTDQNGISDLNEFLAGTNPMDANDYPAIEIRAASAGATLSFEARQAVGTGYENRVRYYTLKQCEDLASGIWTSVSGQEDIPAANQVVNYAASPDNPHLFYRTEIRLN